MTRGGSSTVHIYTQTIHRTTQLILEECGPCPLFTSSTLAFALQLRKKHGKTSVRVTLLANQLKYYNTRYEDLNYEVTFPMKVLRHINNERFLPSKEEVPNSSTTNNSKTQQYIELVSHFYRKIIYRFSSHGYHGGENAAGRFLNSEPSDISYYIRGRKHKTEARGYPQVLTAYAHVWLYLVSQIQ